MTLTRILRVTISIILDRLMVLVKINKNTSRASIMQMMRMKMALQNKNQTSFSQRKRRREFNRSRIDLINIDCLETMSLLILLRVRSLLMILNYHLLRSISFLTIRIFGQIFRIQILKTYFSIFMILSNGSH